MANIHNYMGKSKHKTGLIFLWGDDAASLLTGRRFLSNPVTI